MSISPNQPCPCKSGKKYKKCCRIYHYGQPAESAVILMRSRYSAYAVGEVDYIMSTTHPASPHFLQDESRWREEIARFCSMTAFMNLEIHEDKESPMEAHVRFTATLAQGGEDASFTEDSRFLSVEGQWRYLSAIVN